MGFTDCRFNMPQGLPWRVCIGGFFMKRFYAEEVLGGVY